MFSAVLQQHVSVVLAEVSVLFPISEQCHVDEILGPGLLLGRVDGARLFRRVASLVTDPVPDLLRTNRACQVRSQRHGSRLLMSGIRTEFMA